MSETIVNSDALKKFIQDKGISLNYIAKKLGITYCALYNKLNNKSEFKASEINKISVILNEPFSNLEHLFFANKVD